MKSSQRGLRPQPKVESSKSKGDVVQAQASSTVKTP